MAKLLACSLLFGSGLFLTYSYAEAISPDLTARLASAALERTQHEVIYDGSYQTIGYPMGDVASNRGVCSDVVIRSFRQLNIDLQELVHDDMLLHFEKYPAARIWKQKKPDSNIDHRRVPNLRVWFTRHHLSLSLSKSAADYEPGDIVSWILPGNLPHIGIVSDKKSEDGTPLIVHNIGSGPKLENMLFDFEITGHFRLKTTDSQFIDE